MVTLCLARSVGVAVEEDMAQSALDLLRDRAQAAVTTG